MQLALIIMYRCVGLSLLDDSFQLVVVYDGELMIIWRVNDISQQVNAMFVVTRYNRRLRGR